MASRLTDWLLNDAIHKPGYKGSVLGGEGGGVLADSLLHNLIQLPYILESNPHLFYSFRGLKNQMRIRFAV
jgi:hypothetical protein